MAKQYFPGHNGKCWQPCVYRSSGGAIIAAAQEGTFTPAAQAGGFDSFSFVMFADPVVRFQVNAKRLTAKVHAAALAELEAKVAEFVANQAAQVAPAELDPMRPALVSVVGVAGLEALIPIDEAAATLEARGFYSDGHSKQGGQLREELQRRQQFKGLCGPMWGGMDAASGLPIVRYETWAVYERLSA
jgi:hypothetical protein